MSLNKHQHSQGFTLVEMLVVAPIALLVITGLIGLMVVMVGDTIVSNSKNEMTFNVQNALDVIETNVRLSVDFPNTTGNLIAPQGKDGVNAPFLTTDGSLILGTVATNNNPIDPNRELVYYTQPFGCGADSFKNQLFYTTTVFFVKDKSLWRRTYVPTPPGSLALCSQPWQVNTCSPGYLATATQCKANDSELVRDIKSFSVKYYQNPEDTVPITAINSPNATSLSVSIETEKEVVGRTISNMSSRKVVKIDSRDINLSPPSAPVIGSSSARSTANFFWPGVATATSYIIEYNINGGSWIKATDNTTETSFYATSTVGDTVTIRVYARNSTGTSNAGTAAILITS